MLDWLDRVVGSVQNQSHLKSENVNRKMLRENERSDAAERNANNRQENPPARPIIKKNVSVPWPSYPSRFLGSNKTQRLPIHEIQDGS